MFGIGSAELLIILVIALIVLGPKSLAGVSRSLGKAMGEFRRVSTDFQRAVNVEVAQSEAREAAEKRKASAPQKDEPPADIIVDPVQPPADSPIAQAIAKAKAEAEKAGAQAAQTPPSGNA